MSSALFPLPNRRQSDGNQLPSDIETRTQFIGPCTRGLTNKQSTSFLHLYSFSVGFIQQVGKRPKHPQQTFFLPSYTFRQELRQKDVWCPHNTESFTPFITSDAGTRPTSSPPLTIKKAPPLFLMPQAYNMQVTFVKLVAAQTHYSRSICPTTERNLDGGDYVSLPGKMPFA